MLFTDIPCYNYEKMILGIRHMKAFFQDKCNCSNSTQLSTALCTILISIVLSFLLDQKIIVTTIIIMLHVVMTPSVSIDIQHLIFHAYPGSLSDLHSFFISTSFSSTHFSIHFFNHRLPQSNTCIDKPIGYLVNQTINTTQNHHQ